MSKAYIPALSFEQIVKAVDIQTSAGATMTPTFALAPPDRTGIPITVNAGTFAAPSRRLPAIVVRPDAFASPEVAQRFAEELCATLNKD